MRSLRNERDRLEVLRRLDRLTPDSQPGWGRLSAPTDLARDRQACADLVRRFASSPPSGKGPSHQVLGVLTWPQWGVLQRRHLDHPLRQFGV